jgi:hypothetical protein
MLPGETAVGSVGMQPCRGIAWLGSSRRSLHLREYPSRAPANPHRIGRAACLENHRPKDGIYTTGVLPQFTLRRHICSWRADSCA